jgi:aspartate/methionine/tyrosine aminotransferase
MAAPLSPALRAAFPPPVMEARRWVEGRRFPAERPLINLSQAAPVDPPPPALRRAMAEALERPETHLYGPVLGLPELRAAIAARWSAAYDGRIAAEQVAITAGCNEAFCAALATVAAPGDRVILPAPWYFNHRMWLDMSGVAADPLPCGEDGTPSPEAARALIGPRTRALVLVSPNNPTGAEYPPALIHAFFALCRETGLALILDETYRDFRAAETPAHALFAGEWGDTLIHLYSFSKVFRLTGHRTGALVADAARLAEAEKWLDAVTICPPRLGQIAALHGLETLDAWVAEERAETLRRRAALEAEFAAGVGGWRLLSCGAYFAYLEHPFAEDSDALARRLVAEASLLALPGTMFAPRRAEGGDGGAERTLRLAFANADAAGLAETARRLRAVAGPLRAG